MNRETLLPEISDDEKETLMNWLNTKNEYKPLAAFLKYIEENIGTLKGIRIRFVYMYIINCYAQQFPLPPYLHP